MQRQNSILRANTYQKKGGFAMIMAIAVVLVVSTIMALSLALTTETTKRTVDLYLYEQAELVAKSAVELTMLEIAQRDPTTNCLDTSSTPHQPFLNTDIDTVFDVNVTVQYVFTNTVGACDMYIDDINTSEQNGSALIDVVVGTDANVTTEPIRFFRRTMQKL